LLPKVVMDSSTVDVAEPTRSIPRWNQLTCDGRVNLINVTINKIKICTIDARTFYLGERGYLVVVNNTL
jgi:hypothetical protein